MKKNETKPIENNEERKEEELYTIFDRYLNLFDQAQLNSGKIKWDDRYINCWFSY